MPNVFTNLAGDVYEAADRVGRELIGGLNAVKINSGAQEAAKDDTVRSSFTRPQVVSTTYAPAMTIPEGTDQTVDNKTMTLDTYASIQIPYTGEDQKHLNNGAGYQTVYGNQIQQAMRSITNKMELDIMQKLSLGSGMAFGTSGTTPFASNLNDISNIRRLLVDRGCPDDGQISAIYNTVAGVNLRNLSSLYKVNESGGEELLRRGVLLDLYNVKIRESAQVAAKTAGTGASYLLNGALAIGATSVTVDTGTGTILAGDVVTIGNFKYVAATALSANVFTLNSPLREAAADNLAISVNAASTSNIILHRDAAEIAMRPLANPNGGDAAADMMDVQDQFSGLVFRLSLYRGFHKSMIEIGVLYGTKVWLPDFSCIHLG